MSGWFHAYLSYAQSQFTYTAIDGADYVASLLRMGRIAQGIIACCYLMATFLAIRCVVRCFIRRFPVA